VWRLAEPGLTDVLKSVNLVVASLLSTGNIDRKLNRRINLADSLIHALLNRFKLSLNACEAVKCV
jgi:hypothetical protein